ncbi:MAG: hypothetical protein R3E87_14500 [Burkholderiaceae bacterium]
MSQREAEHAEQELDEVRDRLVERIDALTERLSTPNLLGDALDMFAGDGERADLLSRGAWLVREHPVSAVLIGAGVLGLALGLDDRGGRDDGPQVPSRAGFARANGSATAHDGSLLESERLADGAREAAWQTRYQARRAGQWADANRLAVGLGALALGAAAATYMAARRNGHRSDD